MLNGITLIALVVTIVIIVILASVTIAGTFGENGLIKQSEQAKFETEKADAREQIELVLADAFIEKKVNPEYDENEFLDKFIKDRLKNVGIYTDEIELNGFVFELDRSVPCIGKYKRQSTGPIIDEIKVNDKTTSSISVEVIAKNAEGAKYSYSYKKDTEGEEAWKEAGEESTNTFTFSGLEANVTYNIKVKVENKEGKAEEIVNVLTGELPTGVITITDPVWAGDGTASVTINTEETSLTLQYQIGGIEEGKWTETTRGSTISGLKLGQTLYARLFDGKNGTEPASVTVTDTVEPVVTVTPGGTTTNSVTVSANAVDNESGMIASPTYTYYIKQTSEPDTSYVARATDVPDVSYTFIGLKQETSYDVKVEVKADNAGHVGLGVLTGQVTTKIPGGESGVVEGAITFGTPTWSSETASVTVSTNTGMQIEYQVGAVTEGSWQTISNGGTISNLQHGQTVYARLTDGNNHGDYASVSVTDTVAPVVTVTPGGTTTNSVTVSANAVDNESGMIASPTYTYYIKKTSEADTAYVAKATDVPDASYTFTGLTQETSYDVKVEVKADNAGYTGSGVLTGQVTTKIPGGESGVEQGAITFGTPTWSSGTASVTVSTNTGMKIEYQVGAIIEGSWQNIANEGTIPNLQHGQTVYARLTDGTNHGDYASVSVTDTVAPVVSAITTGTITHNSIAVTVNAVDNESGLATEGTYKYYLNGAEVTTIENNTYTFTGLTAGTEYTIKVEAFDKVGNKGENSITVSTGKKPGMGAGEIEKNPTAYYGSEVRGYTCTSQGVGKWRIFYADSTNIYLIADDYISYQYAPNGKNGTAITKNSDYKLSFNNITQDYENGTWIKQNSKGQKWLSKFLSRYEEATNSNLRSTAYMMDTNVWSVYAGTDAEYAMGSPTLELFCESFKQTHPDEYIECKVASEAGYMVKLSSAPSGNYDYEVKFILENDFNSIYIIKDTSKASGMWLASPSNEDYSTPVMKTKYNGHVTFDRYTDSAQGLRPIVCLKSGVQLNKVSDGVYEIVK